MGKVTVKGALRVAVKYEDRIPGDGMYVVGIDVAPGQYRCQSSGDGYWVRYPASMIGPVTTRHQGEGTVSVVIEPDDTAFDSHMPADWVRVVVRRAGLPEPQKPERTGRRARTILDPDIPADTRKALQADLALVRHVRTGSPWSRYGSDKKDGWRAPMRFILCMVTFIWASPQLGVIQTALMIAVVLGMLSVLRRGHTLPRQRLAELAHANPGWFLVDQDFDDAGRALVVRAQKAIRRVRKATVYQEGLLDAADHEVILPVEEWEIAKALSRVARLRADQAQLLAGGVAAPVEEALAPMRETLDTVVASVTSRVEALERYAARVREADRLFQAHDQLRALADQADEYQDLLASTVRDDLAKGEIERLSRNIEQLRAALDESLIAARQAALEVSPGRN
ncbi:hypothetical protein GCM10009555_055050 [Acrocarpospora macrocephala]|uniref:Uncharacterized protein n=1 Tax=Acrocarpospora macrocephala TaxID=150177 RepID=A0A5M3WN18_9ACTN|nr:hypothetical protein [Acrocarpospora macrocephala]GES10677.1 hypothetical protein Amac_042740 [Acrocarpospora macrocephala]